MGQTQKEIQLEDVRKSPYFKLLTFAVEKAMNLKIFTGNDAAQALDANKPPSSGTDAAKPLEANNALSVGIDEYLRLVAQPRGQSSEQYLMKPEAFMNYFQVLEVTDARETAREATRHATRAFWIALFAVILALSSVVLSTWQICTPVKLDESQFRVFESQLSDLQEAIRKAP